MLGLLFVWHLLFVSFFVFIGVWWLSFVPLFGMVLFFLYSQESSESDQPISKEALTAFLSRHAFSFARCCIMLGGRGLADIMTVSGWTISGWLVIINIILWIMSYFWEYTDGKEMFHVGYYVASFVFFGSIWTLTGFDIFAEFIMAWVAVTMALYAFIIFIGGALGKRIHHSMTYPLFITVNMCVLFLIYRRTNDDLALSLVLGQVYLMILYVSIWRIGKRYESMVDPYVDEDEEVFKSILSGRNLYKTKLRLPLDSHILEDLRQFINRLNSPTRFIISFFNIALVVGQVVYFIEHMATDNVIISEILLRFGIISFFVNYLLLRQIGFYHAMQRLVAFVLINFGIYLTIINLFGNDVIYIVGLGMIWSLLNSLAMFHTGRLQDRDILQHNDYFYRIGANALAVICNLYFVFFLPLSAQFRFFLGLIYFGIWMFMTLYNLKGLRK